MLLTWKRALQLQYKIGQLLLQLIKKASSSNAEDVLLTPFQEIFDKSIDQLKVIADTLMQGHEDRYDISNELKDMGLFLED
ncbi:hypothetical protein FEM48_Zijuj10G0081400 [Ziziphus jujuba var. spinosa]|uniref:Uncharacterized protein n=1 Tax=Ziziphus jujuba var. spinosa TaxID=714518 RepID=A0A978UM86_ZIZJJ|nr:hypothetical protein FEM48_Zijuj10G0081400 [Ziziphus jujuba var. spinosa]